MDMQLLIRELGQSLGIAELELDAGQACTIYSNDNAITIQYQPQDESVLIFAPVARNEGGFDSTVYEKLLRANLFGYETLGMHLGYYAPTSSVVLSTSHSTATLSVAEMEDMLNWFLVELQKWQGNLAEWQAEGAELQNAGAGDCDNLAMAGMMRV